MTRSTVFASSIKSIARVTNRPKKRHPHSIVNHGAERCGDGVPVEPIAPIPSAIPKFLLMFSGFRWTALEHPCPIRLNKPRGPGTSTRFEGGTVIDTARLCLMQSRECPSARAISNLVIGDSSHIPVSERPVYANRITRCRHSPRLCVNDPSQSPMGVRSCMVGCRFSALAAIGTGRVLRRQYGGQLTMAASSNSTAASCISELTLSTLYSRRSTRTT